MNVVDDVSTGQVDNITAFLNHPKFRFDQADIVTWAGLQDAAQSADIIYHLAAVVGVRRVLSDPIGVLSTNIVGTERLLRAVSGGQRPSRLMLASSSEVYGFNSNPQLAETDRLIYNAGKSARWSYAVSKLVGEHFASAYAREHGMQIMSLRFFNIIGPRQRGEYGMVVPNFVHQAVRGLPITVYGDGNQTRSFCDVRDAVQMMARLAEATPFPGEIVNLGNDQEITINHLAELVRQRANSSSTIQHLSHTDGYGEHFDDVISRRPDLTLLKTMIEFSPEWTLDRTIDDLISQEVSQNTFESSYINTI